MQISKTQLKNRVQKNIKKGYIFNFISGINLTHGLWMIYLAYKGLSLIEIGLLESIFHITSFTMEIPTGSIADLFGRKVSRILGRAVSLVGLLLLIYSNNFSLFALSFIFSALSYNLESGAGEALIYDSLKYIGKENNFIKFSGISEALLQFASIISFLLGGFIGKSSYSTAFFISAGITLFAFSFSFSFTEPPIKKNEESGRMIKKFYYQIVNSFKFIFKEKAVGFLILLIQVFSSFSTCTFFYLQNYWKFSGRNEFEIGIFLSVASLIAGIISLFIPKIEKKIYGKRLLLLTVFSMTLCIWGIALFDFKLPFFIANTALESILFVSGSKYINNLIPSKYRATIISVGSMMFSFSMIAIFPIFGYIADTMSFFAAFISLAVTSSVLFLFFSLSKGKNKLNDC